MVLCFGNTSDMQVIEIFIIDMIHNMVDICISKIIILNFLLIMKTKLKPCLNLVAQS